MKRDKNKKPTPIKLTPYAEKPPNTMMVMAACLALLLVVGGIFAYFHHRQSELFTAIDGEIDDIDHALATCRKVEDDAKLSNDTSNALNNMLIYKQHQLDVATIQLDQARKDAQKLQSENDQLYTTMHDLQFYAR